MSCQYIGRGIEKYLGVERHPYLTVGDCHLAVVTAGGQTLSLALAGRGSNHVLDRLVRLGASVAASAATEPTKETTEPTGRAAAVTAVALGAVAAVATSTAAEQAAQEPAELALALSAAPLLEALEAGEVILLADGRRGAVVGRRAGATHEGVDHLGGVDGAVALGAAEGAGPSAGDLAVADDGGVGLGAAPVAGAVTGSAVGDCFSAISTALFYRSGLLAG